MRPFLSDIERTREHVLDKDWSDEEYDEITKVPALLVLNTDFDEFSPRADPWLLLHFGERLYGGPEGLAELADTFRAVGEAAVSGDLGDLYEVARDMAVIAPTPRRSSRPILGYSASASTFSPPGPRCANGSADVEDESPELETTSVLTR